ncbi:hypothetical protein J6590_087080 [Homalodisca vitripennis]|nr:hypothetical protein J6590_087080 [Homalodisca vitripennis]
MKLFITGSGREIVTLGVWPQLTASVVGGLSGLWVGDGWRVYFTLSATTYIFVTNTLQNFTAILTALLLV